MSILGLDIDVFLKIIGAGFLLTAWLLEKWLKGKWDEKLKEYTQSLNNISFGHISLIIANSLEYLLRFFIKKLHDENKLKDDDKDYMRDALDFILSFVDVHAKELYKESNKIIELTGKGKYLTEKIRKIRDEIEEKRRKIQPEDHEKHLKEMLRNMDTFTSLSSDNFESIENEIENKRKIWKWIFVSLYIIGSGSTICSFLPTEHLKRICDMITVLL